MRPASTTTTSSAFSAVDILCAIVTEVRHDVDGHTHVAVLADDDPGADVRAWHGRYLYFDPAELELIDGGAP